MVDLLKEDMDTYEFPKDDEECMAVIENFMSTLMASREKYPMVTDEDIAVINAHQEKTREAIEVSRLADEVAAKAKKAMEQSKAAYLAALEREAMRKSQVRVSKALGPNKRKFQD